MPTKARNVLYTLHDYSSKDGSFDYEQYRKVQQDGNKRKIENVWATEPNVRLLSRYIQAIGISPQFGLCHGTRRGKEQEWFRKYLECEVIGTEISDTATSFPHTIQWDFHDVKEEWINSVDFIYSNSFDHSYDPEKCFKSWTSCLRPGGVCIIEHSTANLKVGSLGPFGVDLVVLPYLISRWGNGDCILRELVEGTTENKKLGHLVHLVIQKLAVPTPEYRVDS